MPSTYAYLSGSPKLKTFKLAKKVFFAELQEHMSMEIRSDTNELISSRQSTGVRLLLKPMKFYGVVRDPSLRAIIFLASLYFFSLSVPQENIYIRFRLQKTLSYCPGRGDLCTAKHLFLKNGVFSAPVDIQLLKQVLGISLDSEESARDLARLLLKKDILRLTAGSRGNPAKEAVMDSYRFSTSAATNTKFQDWTSITYSGLSYTNKDV